MKIGIIGTGMIGSSLATLWSKAGHEIFVSSRHPEELADLTRELGATAGTPLEAAEFGEVILISVPLAAIPGLASDVASELAGKVVIDTGNAYEERDGKVYPFHAPHSNGSTAWVADHFPGAFLAKAFNTMYYKTLLSESGKGLAVPLASDNEIAINASSQLIRDAGYEPFVVGSLAEGKTFEPGTPVYGKAGTAAEVAQLIQAAVGGQA